MFPFCPYIQLPHYEPKKRKAQVHVKVCDLCYEKYKAKPLMNLDQLNHLSKQISADSKSAKNNSGSSLQRFQVENEEDYESDSDDLSMYTMKLQHQVSDPGSGGSYNSPGTSSLKFFGNMQN